MGIHAILLFVGMTWAQMGPGTGVFVSGGSSGGGCSSCTSAANVVTLADTQTISGAKTFTSSATLQSLFLGNTPIGALPAYASGISSGTFVFYNVSATTGPIEMQDSVGNVTMRAGPVATGGSNVGAGLWLGDNLADTTLHTVYDFAIAKAPAAGQGVNLVFHVLGGLNQNSGIDVALNSQPGQGSAANNTFTWAGTGLLPFHIGNRGNISNKISMWTSGHNYITFDTANDTGFVGIGSTSPGFLLDVGGTARVQTLNATSAYQLAGIATEPVFPAASTFSMGSVAAGQTAFGVCSASVTVATNGGRVGVHFSGSGSSSSASATVIGLNVLMDGTFLSGYSSTVGMISAETPAIASAPVPLTFDVLTPAPVATSHTYCITSKAASGNFTFDTVNTQPEFWVQEQ